MPFTVGETLTYDILLSSFLAVGTASTRVTGRTAAPAAPGYTLVAEGQPLPAAARLFTLNYRLDSELDSVSLLARHSVVRSENARRVEVTTTRFNRTARTASIERRRDSPDAHDVAPFADVPIPARATDPLAMLYALRAATLVPGARLEVPVTVDGATVTVGVRVGPPERVQVPFGTVEALVLTITARGPDQETLGEDMVVWLSTDARRLPVKMQANLPVGSFVLALREAK